jgi:hypothetical protein
LLQTAFFMQQRVTLKFDDERDLRRFTIIVEPFCIEMNTKTLTLTCDCDEAEMELAKNAFHAEVVDAG